MKKVLIYGAEKHLGFDFAMLRLQQGDTVTLIGNSVEEIRYVAEQLAPLAATASAATIGAVSLQDLANHCRDAATSLSGITDCVIFADDQDAGTGELSAEPALSQIIKATTTADHGARVRVVIELSGQSTLPLSEKIERFRQYISSRLQADIPIGLTLVGPLFDGAAIPLPAGISPTNFHSGISRIVHLLNGVKKRSGQYLQQYPTRVSRAGLSDFNVAKVSDCIEHLNTSLEAGPTDRIVVGQTCSLESILDAIAISTGHSINAVPQLALDHMDPVSQLVHELLAKLAVVVPTIPSSDRAGITVLPVELADLIKVVSVNCHPVAAEQPESPHSFMEANTLSPDVTYYKSGGAGNDIVLVINAFGLSIEFWREFILKADSKFKFIIIDRKRNSSSSLTQGYYASPDFIETLISDTRSIMATEGFSTFHIASWCAGGKLALELASALPDMTKSLLFITPSFAGIQGYAGADSSYERNLQMMSNLVVQSPKIANNIAKSMIAVITKSEADPTRFAADRKDWVNVLSLPDEAHKSLVYAPFASAENMLDYSEQVIRFRNHDITKALNNPNVLRKPTLLITGSVDTNTSTERATDICGRMENCVQVNMNGGSHYLLHQEADSVAKLFASFARQLANLDKLVQEVNKSSHCL